MKDEGWPQASLEDHGPDEEFAAYIKAEVAKWGKVIRAAGIKAE